MTGWRLLAVCGALVWALGCLPATGSPPLNRDQGATGAAIPAQAVPVEQTQRHSSAIAVSPDGGVIVAVNPDSDSITVMRAATLTVIAQVPVESEPRSVAIDARGSTAYVTARATDRLLAVDVTGGRATWSVGVGDEPHGVVVDSVAGRAYVANFGSGGVNVIDTIERRVLASIDTGGEPVGLALSDDGRDLYVTDFFTGRLTVVDTAGLNVVDTIASWPDANLSGSVVLSASGARAFLPQTRSRVDTRDLLFDSLVLPVVTVVDLKTRSLQPRLGIALDVVDRPVGRPWDAVVSGDGSRLYVANAGSNDLSVIDLETGVALAHVDVQDNPEGIVLSPDGGTAYVNNTLAGTVSVIDTASFEVIATVPVTEIPLDPEVLLGKQLFHTSARTDMARDQWVSCAACHPFGLMDKRVWPLASGPRNTILLTGAGETMPITWSRERDEIQDNEFTIRVFMGGTGLIQGEIGTPLDTVTTGRSRDLDAIAAYVRSLRFPPNPNLGPDGALSGSAERGRNIFVSFRTRCLACHMPPLYTDRQPHDVGTGDGPAEAAGPAFDTPSLRGVYRTAPYLHDGSAATLRDVFTTRNVADRHGVTSHLTSTELDDLVAYLRSLPAGEGWRPSAAARVSLLRAALLVSGHGGSSQLALLAKALWTGSAALAVAVLVLTFPNRALALSALGLIPTRWRRVSVAVVGLPLLGTVLALAYAIAFAGLVTQPSWEPGAILGAIQWLAVVLGVALAGTLGRVAHGRGVSLRRSWVTNGRALGWTAAATLAFGTILGLLQGVG